jgi:ABC-type antimicrobial peptide transport system permease subunit
VADDSLSQARFTTLLLALFAALALTLATIGIYGVISLLVTRRRQEIGIRIALGARPSAVLGNVMRQGFIVTMAGLGAGCILAAAAAVAVSRALYGVGAADPVSWISAAAIVVGVSALANLVPAWRAARVNPSIALRTE